MSEERKWDEEFWHLAGTEAPIGDDSDDLEDVPNLAIIDLNEVPAYGEYIELLKRREQIEIIQNQVYINGLQSKTFLQAMTALTLIFAMFFSLGWTIWYMAN